MIAIVGASCRFPGASNLQRFEHLLFSGGDAVTEIPDERWSKPLFLHPDAGQPGKSYTFAAGIIDNIYGFDAAFFGISPREAVQMDPQQRLLLELAHEAFEDAGADAGRLAGHAVGVYVGGSSWDHLNRHIGDPSATDAYSMTGSTFCSLSNRISHVFDLRGPSLTVDTACSSSLVALHLACEAMRRGEVTRALVGGVNLLLAPHSFVGFSRASMLSRRGRCHAFDARADGYVRAEGGGMVMLAPLHAALEAGLRVRGIIRATGMNSDGHTPGFSLPSGRAQAALLRDTYSRFAISPDEIDYLEAHGTGTPAGDPIEAGALGAVLGQARATPLPIGSVKTNIGHLEAGSGMAGLMKALLVLERRAIPPSLHCETPNPAIDFEGLNLALVPRLRELRANGHLPAIGINSFGFGGTNAHAVIGTAPPVPPSRPAGVRSGAAPAAPLPLLLSARSDAALRELAGAWRDRLDEAGPAEGTGLVRAAARRRQQHPVRLAVLGATASELSANLAAHLAGTSSSAVVSGSAVPGDLAFVFSGNGSQWAGMGRDARRNPVFEAALAKLDRVLRPGLGWSLRERLDSDDLELDRTETAQPLLFALQVASVEALRAAGLRPAFCMGHSVGEAAAAWASGALTLAQAARVIQARSQRQQTTHGNGGMAVLALPPETAESVAARFGLEIAAINATASVTVAGPVPGLDALAEEALRQGWNLTRLGLSYAFHSEAMDPIRGPLLADLQSLRPHAGSIPFVSTVTGDVLDGSELDAAYWWENVRRPVRFADAARALIRGGVRHFLEIGPQPVLQSYLQDALRAADMAGAVLPCLSRRRHSADPIEAAALRCHVAGHDISAHPRFDGTCAADLPVTPFQRETYRLASTDESTSRIAPFHDHAALGGRVGAEAGEWLAHADTTTWPWLADHAVGGAPVLPAAAIIDMLLAAAGARHPQASSLELTGLEIGRALAFQPGQTRALRTRAIGTAGLELASRARLSGEAWTVHATAACGPAATSSPLRDWDGASWRAEGEALDSDTLYRLAARLGLDYGPSFRVVQSIAVLGDRAARVRLAAVPERGALDPALLDGALQGLLALAAGRADGNGPAMLPWRFGRVRRLGNGQPAEARLRLTEAGPRAVSADILLLDASGVPVAELLECWFVAVRLNAADPAERFLRLETVSVADPAMPPPGPGVLEAALAAVSAPEGDELAAALADAFVAGSAAAALGAVPPEETAAESAPLRARLAEWADADGLADLPPPDSLIRSLLFDATSAAADAALLAAAGDGLAATLRDATPLAVPSPALLDQFLTHSPAGRRGLAALADAASAVAVAWPESQALRVLELGAGSASVTSCLARRLLAGHAECRLLAATTDAQRPALAEAMAGLDHVTVAAGIPPGERFDLVLSLHGLTRGGLAASELAELRECLAPGGVLLAVEPAPNRVWEFIGVPAQDGSPAEPRDGDAWCDLLALAGFAVAPFRPIGSVWPASLLAARSTEAAVASPLPADDAAAVRAGRRPGRGPGRGNARGRRRRSGRCRLGTAQPRRGVGRGPHPSARRGAFGQRRGDGTARLLGRPARHRLRPALAGDARRGDGPVPGGTRGAAPGAGQRGPGPSLPPHPRRPGPRHGGSGAAPRRGIPPPGRGARGEPGPCRPPRPAGPRGIAAAPRATGRLPAPSSRSSAPACSARCDGTRPRRPVLPARAKWRSRSAPPA